MGLDSTGFYDQEIYGGGDSRFVGYVTSIPANEQEEVSISIPVVCVCVSVCFSSPLYLYVSVIIQYLELDCSSMSVGHGLEESCNLGKT